MSSFRNDQFKDSAAYTRRVANAERLFTLSPFSVVGLVARVEGDISCSMLRQALDKARQRHPLLGARIVWDGQGDPWFTTAGAGDIPIETVRRVTDDQWIDVIVRERQVTFEFGARPPVRIILVQADHQTDMIILCHHIICDGMSLAYLARDLLTYLGDPTRLVDETLAPAPVDADSLPPNLGPNWLVAGLIGRVNRKWQVDKVTFDQQDYADLSQAYWRHYDHRCLAVELTEGETAELVARCRENGVTVNSALAAAFAGGQASVLGPRTHSDKLSVAVSVRPRLGIEVGEAMGFYAAAVDLACRYRQHQGYWDNARRYHKAIRARLDDRHVLDDLVTWCHLDPTLLEAVNYKKLGHLLAPDQPSHAKLAAFARQEDALTRLLKHDGQLALDRIMVGTAITNLTRLDFASDYGNLRLDRMMMVPGGAYPLVNCGLVLGAATVAGKLSLTVEYAEQAVSTANMMRIRDKAMDMLLGTARAGADIATGGNCDDS